MTTGTPLSEVFDLAMQEIDDFHLINLYNQDVVTFETYMSGFLRYAIQEFDICNQSLDFSLTTMTFTQTLTEDNKIILARLMKVFWMDRNVTDVKQMTLRLQDKREFNTYAEANNLQQKSNHLDKIRENCSQVLINYGYKNLDWSTWFNQSFGG